MLSDRRQLETYLSRCAPPFSWDKEPEIDFFRLMGLIWKHFDNYKPHIEIPKRNRIESYFSNDR